MNINDSHIVPVGALRLSRAQSLSRSLLQGRGQGREKCARFTFGAATVDAALAGRVTSHLKNEEAHGLPLAQLHEVHAAETEDCSSAAAVTSFLAIRSRIASGSETAPIVWVRDHGDARKTGWIYPPGLVQLGIDPGHILYVDVSGSVAVLRAAADAVRSSSIGAVIIELMGKYPKGLDLTATRRLSLFAQKSGVTVFLLRSQSASSSATSFPGQEPSAAYSRWQVASAPSRALAANAVGHPVFDMTLLRHRGGVDGLTARLEWNCDRRSFEVPANIGAVPAISGSGTDRESLRKSA